MSECTGFVWVGQSFDHCEECGRDIADHDGMHDKHGTVPFEEFEHRSPIFSHYVTATDGSGAKRWWAVYGSDGAA